MITGRLIYRTRQFWMALKPAAAHADLEIVATYLNDEQIDLFRSMQPSEQAHSLHVLKTVLERGEQDNDLCVAALLHDVGKIRYPLHLWERVYIVLAQGVCPECIRSWGDGQWETAAWWRRAFIVGEQHPRWGAEMVAAAGGSSMAVDLIRRHQEKLASPVQQEMAHEEILLRVLQSVDDLN